MRRLGHAGSALLVLGLACVLAGAQDAGAGGPGASRTRVPPAAAGTALPNFDIQEGRRGSTRKASPRLLPGAAVPCSGLPDSRVRYDALTHTASRVSRPNGKLTGPSRLDPEVIARRFLAAHPELYGQTGPEVDALYVARRYASPGLDVTHVWLNQQFRGIPVFMAEAKVDVTFRGEILATSGALVPGLARTIAARTPRISAGQALGLAMTYGGMRGKAQPPALHAPLGARRKVTFALGEGLERQPEAELIYFPTAPGHTALAWETTLYQTDDPNLYHLLVDAATGQLLFRNNYTADAQGLIYPREAPQDSTPTTGSPPPVLERVLELFDGGRPFNGGPLFPSSDPHFDWWNTQPQTSTSTNNVLAGEARNQSGSNGNDPAPVAASTGDFNFALDLSQEPSTYTSAAVTNLFYWINRLHDTWYRFGFTEAAGNFQNDNFSLGGFGNDRVRALAQFGANTGSANNANMGTPPDGFMPTVRLFEWTLTNPRRDSDLDNGIIAHEYGHGVTNRLVGNANGLTLFQPRAMGEGWSDFQALMVLAEASDDVNGNYPIGAYALNEFNRGIRNQPYSTNPLVFTRGFGSINHGGIHSAGEIMCDALWNTYARLAGRLGFQAGRARVMQLFIDALKLAPTNPTFLDYRDKLILADQIRYAGADVNDIWAAFADRGMGFLASTTGPADRAPVESFQLPPFTVSGRVATPGGAGVEGVTVQATGWEELTTTTAPADVPRAIPDGDPAGVESTVNISSTGVLTLASIRANITHTRRGDLEIALIHPDGTRVLLQAASNDSTDNFTNLTLGTTALRGKPMAGVWKLRVRDLVGGEPGTLASWGLTLGSEVVFMPQVVTGPDGTYVLSNLRAGTYTLMALKDEFDFTPATRLVTGGPDQPDQDFTLAASILVTSPNGGELQVVNTNEPITWTSSGISDSVKIDYSIDGGINWIPLLPSTPDDGFALWTVQGPDTGQARIRVADAANASTFDTSDANFSIASPTIRVLSPDGGEILTAGKNVNLRWLTTNVADAVKIDYSINAGLTWLPIYNITENDGVALWTVQPPATTNALIRVAQASNPARFDTSAAFFSIQTPTFTLTSPNGGEIQQIGANQPITWMSSGFSGSVRLDYSNLGGAPGTWIPILLSTENDGFALWTVQGPPSTQARIRVSAAGNQAISDASDGDFIETASHPITVASPNGGESQVVGTDEPITWTSSGISGNVKIDYSTDGGVSWAPIYASTPNDGHALWTVQAPMTAQARIRVSAVADPTLADTSDGNFTIRPDLALNYPSISDLAIPDNNSTGIEVPLLVSSIHKLHAVHVTVNITHTWIGDLEVSIVHPDGTAVKLHNQSGGSADNLVTKYPIFTLPAESLGVLNGKPMGGTWKLRVRDLAAADAGRLNSWVLTTVY
jgi:extracellular elastinolytic metalloproteinase